MTDERERESGAFKVTDRRSFTPEGELRRDTGQDPGSAKSPPPQARPNPSPSGPKAAPGEQPRARTSAGPGMDFSSFLLSLATTALVHLGETVDRTGARGKTNLDAAKQMVDILAMLQQKTEGNRTEEENRLLDDILYEIRMKILAKTRKIQL